LEIGTLVEKLLIISGGVKITAADSGSWQNTISGGNTGFGRNWGALFISFTENYNENHKQPNINVI